MSTDYRVCVTVIVRHQSTRADEIASELGWKPFVAWSAGDDRVTPTGTKLSGSRKDTACTFSFDSDEEDGTPIVAETVKHLLSRRTYVKELLSSGGTISLSVGLNGVVHSYVELSPHILRDLSELGIVFGIECFP